MTPSNTLAVLGNPVAFYPGLVPITGSIKATLMFCQIFYWCQRTTNPLGVYKSVSDFEAEIHLSYKEQIAARKRLVELGLIVEEYDRAQHRVYFSVDTEVLDQLLLQQELAHDKKEGGTCQKVSYHLTKGKFGNTETTTKTTSKKPRASLAGVDVENFETFWKSYPSKVGKDAARKAFAKRKFDEKTFAQVLQALELHKVSERWTKDNGQYIPNPDTWLNQGRWEDEMPGAMLGGDNPAFAGII